MITRISPYSIKTNYKPNFGAVIPKGHYIPVRRRGEVIPEKLLPKVFNQAKEVFFEMFPKLDPEYVKIKNNA